MSPPKLLMIDAAGSMPIVVATIATHFKRHVAILEHDAISPARYAVLVFSEWLQSALMSTGMSQASLARHLTQALGKSIDRAAVNKMKAGTREISGPELVEIARFLKVPLPVDKSETTARPVPKQRALISPEPPNAFVGDKLSQREEYLPLYGHAVGGVDGEFVLNGNELDSILAPPGLHKADGAYAVTCAGDSMEPRYFDGETVFVNPRRRVRRGDFVVAQIRNPKEGDAPLGYIKRFVSRTDNELVLEQFNPPKQLRFPGGDVESVHYIALGGQN